jgi:hypothetical protein
MEAAKVLADKTRDAYLSSKPGPGLRIIRVPSDISKEAFDLKLSQALAESASRVRH